MKPRPPFVFALVCLIPLSVVSQANAVSNVRTFFATYTNPEQELLPKDGIYPLGQRMPISGYSSNSRQQRRMQKAGFSLDGPHYHHLGKWMLPNWRAAESAGMKNFFRLRISNLGKSAHWGAVLPRMKSKEGRAELRRQITELIDYVQSDRRLDRNIVGWYGYPEEPMEREHTSLRDQRAYIKFVHDILMETDKKKRPYYVSERGDSSPENMMANQRHQDGVLKQNYLIAGNAYSGDDELRVLMWQWARDQVIAAEKNDAKYPSYTGHKRAAISTLSMYIDPKDESRRNKGWLRKIITHDVYIQLAAGIDGFMLYSWSRSGEVSQETKERQEDIYMDVLGLIAEELGEVFLWGDDRNDIKKKHMSGPRTVKWKKCSAKYKDPSIRMRNIHYGYNRYILLVNSAKEAVMVRLSGFPIGVEVLDMIPGKRRALNSADTPPIAMQPLAVRMYKISMEKRDSR